MIPTSGLIENQELLKMIIASFPDHIYIWDIKNNKRVIENTNTSRELGYEREPVADGKELHHFYQSLLHPDSIQMHLDFRAAVHHAKENEIYEMTICIKAANGEWRWLNYREKLLQRDSEGNPWLMLGVARDVTDKIEAEKVIKQANAALAASQSRLQAIVDSQSVYVSRYKLTGELTFVNPAICDLMQTTAEQLIGKSFFQFIRIADQIEVIQALKQLSPENSVIIVEHRITLPDGSIRWQHWINRAIFNSEQTLVEFQATGWDITEQKEAESNTSQLISIIEATPDLVCTIDAQMNLIYLNQAGKDFFGIAAEEELTHFQVIQFFPEGIGEHVVLKVFPEVNQHGIWKGETSIINANNEVIPVSLVLVVHRDERGDVERYSLNFRDIRNLKEIERKIREKELQFQEQQTRYVVTELHDRIGQNLTALNLNLTMLNQLIQPLETPQLQNRVDDCMQLVDETMKSIRGIMSELRPPELDDYGLISALRSAARQFNNRSGVSVVVEGECLQPRLPIAIELTLYRIFQEALTNVAKHANATKVEIKLQEKKNLISLTITDNGKGFSLDTLNSNKEYKGWGLAGMYACATDIGARLSVSSNHGKGTRIRVEMERNA